jgi:pyruvate dehydrogenase E2 component (dihydrolipoamide acetyltransferase)
MAHRIVMPSFGMYTAEGNLGRWLLPAGSRVEAGDLIADLITEKATYDLEAPAAGVLHPVAAEGESLQVEGLIGWILEDGETVSEDSSRRQAEASAEAVSNLPGEPAPASGRLRASPLARRIAADEGIDLHTLTGTGPSGRIVEADVLAAAQRGAAPPPSAAPWKLRGRLPLTGARKTIGDRLRRSVETAVSLTLTREARVEALVAARTELGDRLGASVPYDALLLKVFAAALRERPAFHAVIDGTEILLLDEVHLGFAVSVSSEAGGLVVPVVRDVDRRGIGAVAEDVRALTAKARAGALRPQDVLGGVATLSILGAYGVDAFTPVLNPPQALILGVGRIAQRPVVEAGQLAVGTTCVLSLTFDHRVADGAPAAELLDAVVRRLDDRTFLTHLD